MLWEERVGGNSCDVGARNLNRVAAGAGACARCIGGGSIACGPASSQAHSVGSTDLRGLIAVPRYPAMTSLQCSCESAGHRYDGFAAALCEPWDTCRRHANASKFLAHYRNGRASERISISLLEACKQAIHLISVSSPIAAMRVRAQ